MPSIQVDLNDVSNIDIAFDAVDEVDFNKNILKVEVLICLRVCCWYPYLMLWYSLSWSEILICQGSGATHTVQKVG